MKIVLIRPTLLLLFVICSHNVLFSENGFFVVTLLDACSRRKLAIAGT